MSKNDRIIDTIAKNYYNELLPHYSNDDETEDYKKASQAVVDALGQENYFKYEDEIGMFGCYATEQGFIWGFKSAFALAGIDIVKGGIV